ncbi:MAG: class II fructose-bisphosphate aldolase [Sedimentisphaerales bacterium]|nr:class II fructose-bisphosphate aldolase [Sedimentisphaerales bacterium]
MPLIRDRNAVLEVFDRAARRQWVIPAFCAENPTTIEAVLTAAREHARRIKEPRLPVILAITNQYAHRSQSVYYTHTRRWDIGLRRFMADIEILTDQMSPFSQLNVMVLLDHTQWDADAELLTWDLRPFSIIMYDASGLPFDENIKRTAQFVEQHGREIVIEGACDEILDAGESSPDNALATPEKTQCYLQQTGVDFVVVNLGTEHRAGSANLTYHGGLARRISTLTGPKLVLHGASSVGGDQIKWLFHDGIAKVNIWTALERDSSPALLEEMLRQAAKITGPTKARELLEQGLLGPKADITSQPQLSHYTTTWRQDIIFQQMKDIAGHYFNLWCM